MFNFKTQIMKQEILTLHDELIVIISKCSKRRRSQYDMINYRLTFKSQNILGCLSINVVNIMILSISISSPTLFLTPAYLPNFDNLHHLYRQTMYIYRYGCFLHSNYLPSYQKSRLKFSSFIFPNFRQQTLSSSGTEKVKSKL